MVETASRLMSERPREWPTIAVVARAMNMSRTTAYYYFQGQDGFVEAARWWVVEQLTQALDLSESNPSSFGAFVRFALTHPHAVKLLVDQLLSPAQNAEKSRAWGALIDAAQKSLANAYPAEVVDSGVHMAWLLGGAALGPVILFNSLGASEDSERIAARFQGEQHRLLEMSVVP
jgi:AcrR family transcriptional regulator